MRHCRRLLLTPLVAAFALALAASAAPATAGIGFEPNAIEAIASNLTIASTEVEATIICALSLQGTLHEQVTKIPGALAGFIEEGEAEECTSSLGGVPTLNPQLPSHVTFSAISGELPNISQILMAAESFGFLLVVPLEPFQVECLFSGDIDLLSNESVAREGLTELSINGDVLLLFTTLGEAGFLCPTSVTMTGTLLLTEPIEVALVS